MADNITVLYVVLVKRDSKCGTLNGLILVSLLLRRAFWRHLICYTPTNALLYCNSLKSLH